jgi:hypothetical protein
LDVLQSLIDQEFREGKAVDYKRTLWSLNEKANPEVQNRARIEFLKDVSSFANAEGGHLLVGMEEEEGKPTRIVGIQEADTDKRANQLDQLLQSWIQPRINAGMRFVPHGDGRYVLIIQVDSSMIGPHRVCYDNHGQFYSRNSTGTYHMDTEELRIAFNKSQLVAERMRAFRNGRARMFELYESTVPVPPGPTLIFHLIPQSAFTANNRFSLAQLKEAMGNASPLSANINYTHDTINLDGVLRFVGRDSTGNPSNVRTYLQLFQSGVIEAVDADISYTNEDKSKRFWRPQNENYLLESIPEYFQILDRLGVHPPFWILLTVVHARRVVFPFDPMLEKRFDRDSLQLPEILVSAPTVNPAEITRQLADMVWNAAGIDKCHSINDKGEWVSLRTCHH